MRVEIYDVEYNLVECRVDSINRMNKTFDEPDDDVHPSSAGGCWRCGTAQKKKRTRAGTRRWNKKKSEREREREREREM